MPFMITNPTTIPTSTWCPTANQWNSVNVSANIPTGAPVGIFLHSGTSGHALANLGARANGDTATWQQTMPGNSTGGQTMRIVPLDSNGICQFYPSATNSGTVLQFVGYFNLQDLVPLTTAFLLTPGVGSSYTTYNPSVLSSGLVPSSAIGVVLGMSKAGSGTFGIRQAAPDDNIGSGGAITQACEITVGLSASGTFQARSNAAAPLLSLYVIGYIPSGAGFIWNPSAISRTPATANTPVAVTTESNAILTLYQVTGGINYTISSPVVSGLPFLLHGAGAAGQIMSGPSPQANLSSVTAPANLLELAYWVASAAPFTPFTKNDFIVQDRLIVT